MNYEEQGKSPKRCEKTQLTKKETITYLDNTELENRCKIFKIKV